MRPRGRPPMPRATSRAIEPVGITSTGTRVSSPSRMIEPLPNCRSIWRSAASSALPLSPTRSGIAVLLLGAIGDSLSLGCLCQAGCDLRRPALEVLPVLDVLRPLPTPHTLRVTTDIPGPHNVFRAARGFRAARAGQRNTSRTRGAPTSITIGERLLDHGHTTPD